MAVVSELELPYFDHTDPTLGGERYRAAMAGLHGFDGWLAQCPFGFMVLDREASEFFLRTRAAVFPGLTIAQLFGIEAGPLHEEVVRNIININGADHSTTDANITVNALGADDFILMDDVHPNIVINCGPGNGQGPPEGDP